MYVDGNLGSEHWYAGAGIYRSVHLVRTSKVHLDAGSLYFVTSPDADKITRRAAGGAGGLVAPATVQSTVVVVNDGTAFGSKESSAASVAVTVRVLDSDGAVVATTTSPAVSLAAGGNTVVHLPDVRIAQASLWTVQTPHLYTAECTVANVQTGAIMDAVNTNIGVRSTSWDYDKGFFLNSQNVKIRGFCHHDDFTGVGMAVPDRIWLLTAMQNRGVGANAWRTSQSITSLNFARVRFFKMAAKNLELGCLLHPARS